METIDATTLRWHLSRVLGEVEFAGRSFRISKNGKVVAEIRPPVRSGKSHHSRRRRGRG